MKTMLISELLLWKDSIVRIMLLYLAIGIVCSFIGENPWMAGAMVSCMFAIGSALAGPASDDTNDWATSRLCLPVSRRDVVLGRYASTVVFTLVAVAMGLIATGITCALAMVIFPNGEICGILADGDIVPTSILSCTFSLVLVAVSAGVYYPLSFKLGNKKALRLVPVAVVLLCTLIFAMLARHELFFSGPVMDLISADFSNSVTPVIVGFVIVYVVFMAISCAISVKLHETREL